MVTFLLWKWRDYQEVLGFKLVGTGHVLSVSAVTCLCGDGKIMNITKTRQIIVLFDQISTFHVKTSNFWQ